MVLVYGSDRFLLKKQISKIVKKVIENAQSHEITEYSLINDQWSKIYMDAITLDMFSDVKVVIIHDSYFLTEKKIKLASDFNVDDVYNLLKTSNSKINVIFSLNEDKISKKLKIAKEFQDSVKVIPVLPLKKDQILDQVTKTFESKAISYDKEAIDYFVEVIGDNMELMQNEITKLVTLKKHIDVNLVNNVVTKSLDYNIFNISNALIQNKIPDFIKMWNNYIDMNGDAYSFLQLMTANIVDLRNILYGKSNNMNQSEVADKFLINPYRVKILWNMVINNNWKQLNNIIENMYSLIYNKSSIFITNKKLVEIKLLEIFCKES